MRSTYKNEDVTILLKDITGIVNPIATEEREKLIQSGTHYSEMLPVEYKPTEKYMEVYRNALNIFSEDTANAVAVVSQKILNKKGEKVVLVSLARAGTSIGVLIKRYFKDIWNIEIPHYTISIIRGRGIDKNAIDYLLKRYPAELIQFVDGWIGKGAILNVLKEAVAPYGGVSPELAVLADPANMTELCGTHEEILIPSSCLNCTVSGLISRTFLRNDIIKGSDFHGAVYYGELLKEDLTYDFIECVEKNFKDNIEFNDTKKCRSGYSEVEEIAANFKINDVNLINPGIGETTRVLLRRVPWKILINEKYADDISLKHIFQLAEEKNVEVVLYPLENYRACGIIKEYGDI